jgi:ribosomal protein S18 acetylase RimI-like enzyme
MGIGCYSFYMNYIIRQATIDDLEQIAALEALCFPPAEAASFSVLASRLASYPSGFFVAEVEGRIVSMVAGPITYGSFLVDSMYADTSCYAPSGKWQMIFGVETHPSYRGQGIAGAVLSAFLSSARSLGLRGAVLTCKPSLVPYYARFGFVSEGESSSTHGGATWYQMRITF